jgi:hypothetical protein
MQQLLPSWIEKLWTPEIRLLSVLQVLVDCWTVASGRLGSADVFDFGFHDVVCLRRIDMEIFRDAACP